MHLKKTGDEATIVGLVENWAQAVRARNLDGILANHSPDMLMFDVPPPLQSKGIEEYKETWDLFFSWAQDSGVFDILEMYRLELRGPKGYESGSNRLSNLSAHLTDQTPYKLAFVSNDNADLCDFGNLTEGEARWMAHIVLSRRPKWFRA